MKSILKYAFFITLIFAVYPVYAQEHSPTADVVLKAYPAGTFGRFDQEYSAIQADCGDRSDALILKRKYSDLMELALECRARLKEELRELDKSVESPSIEGYEERKALAELTLDELEYLYSYSSLLDSEDQDELTLMTEYFMLTDRLMSRYYILKSEHQEIYAKHMDTKYVTNIVENFRQFNNKLGETYDDTYRDDVAKYFLQINPNNEAVVHETERLIQGTKDPDIIRWRIFDFVRDGIYYKHDPQWKTDWVQPPSLTLLAGKGDCDDQSVLLASMFMRAGVPDVQLCYTDDHMIVSAAGIKWDPTCKKCDEVPSEPISEATCVDVNKFISRLGKCSDGTEYDSCSQANPGLFCDQAGQLRHACGACGCSGSSYCDTQDQQCFKCQEGMVGFEGKKCCPAGTTMNLMGMCI